MIKAGDTDSDAVVAFFLVDESSMDGMVPDLDAFVS